MKPSIRYLTITSLAALALAGAMSEATAQTTVTIDPGTLTNGFMNVFDLPAGATLIAGGGPADGAFQFQSSWGVGDLVSSFSGSTLTLAANQINDPHSYWYQGTTTTPGGPGVPGNKFMDANLYNETTGMYVGTTLTFTGDVLFNALNGAVNTYNNTTYSSVAFIKDFVPDYSSFTQVTVPLSPGAFSISLLTSANAGDHIQYGFETIGSDVWAGDPLLANGNLTAVIAPVPEPASLALLGLGAAAALAWRRRQ